MITDKDHAMSSAKNHLNIDWGYCVVNRVTVAIVEGPAMRGTARGTTIGSSVCFESSMGISLGKIIRKAMRKRITPPEMLNAYSEILRPDRI